MKILNVKIDSLSEAKLQTELEKILTSDTFHHLATVNPEFLVEAQKNQPFQDLLNNTHLNICDGAGISLWSKILYKKSIQKIPGVQVAEMICATAAQQKKSVYLLGGFGVTDKAVEHLVSQYPNITVAGHQDGRPDQLPDEVINAKTDIILVAFGAPKQEFWLQKYGPQIPGLRLGVGIGGTFDFWAGKAKRAPKLMQTLGLEWLWRLIVEPHRWKRIYKAVVVFSCLAIKERLTNKKRTS